MPGTSPLSLTVKLDRLFKAIVMTHWRIITNLALCPEDFRDCSAAVHNPSRRRHSLEAQEERPEAWQGRVLESWSRPSVRPSVHWSTLILECYSTSPGTSPFSKLPFRNSDWEQASKAISRVKYEVSRHGAWSENRQFETRRNESVELPQTPALVRRCLNHKQKHTVWTRTCLPSPDPGFSNVCS